MLLNPINFYSPQTVSEALSLYSSLGECRLLAGGTFLLNSLKLLKKKGMKTVPNIISLRKIAELKGITTDPETLTIKSMTSITDLYNSPHLTDNFAILKKVCRNISTNLIRNMATVGGNLTSRYTWTELGAPLIALDTKMHFVGSNTKEEVTVEEFFNKGAKTNNLLTHLSIKRDKKCQLSYQRVKKLSEVDVPLLGACIRSTLTDERFQQTKVVINSGTVFAKRDIILEEFLNKSEIEESIASEALNHLDLSIYDTRSDDYKKSMFRVCIKNAILELVQRRKKL